MKVTLPGLPLAQYEEHKGAGANFQQDAIWLLQQLGDSCCKLHGLT